jgi:hypothetical protein
VSNDSPLFVVKIMFEFPKSETPHGGSSRIRYQAASVELLTEGQFQEQIALLSQCQKSQSKSSQLRDRLQGMGAKTDGQPLHS